MPRDHPRICSQAPRQSARFELLAHNIYRRHLTAEGKSKLLALIETGEDLLATHVSFLFRKEFCPPTAAEVEKYQLDDEPYGLAKAKPEQIPARGTGNT